MVRCRNGSCYDGGRTVAYTKESADVRRAESDRRSPERDGAAARARLVAGGELPGVGQIYLLDNPLLTEPLTLEHVKPRLLGHWGTTPGLNFVYAHLNRVIIKRDLNMIPIIGPGHGGPPWWPTPGWRAATASSIQVYRATRRACSACSSNSLFQAASQAIAPRMSPARSTRAASSVIPYRTPSARHSTIRISLSPV